MTTMKIAYDAKRYYHNRTGLGNYSRTLVGNITSRYADVEAQLYDCSALQRTFRLGRKAAKDGCLLLHGLSNELPRDVLRSGLPSVVTMHDVAWLTFPDMYKPWDRAIYDWKYGWSARHATHVVCISESTKCDVMRYYGVPEERISVVYQPVSEQYYTPISHEEALMTLRENLPYAARQPYILTVGSINSRKNLMGMMQAYANIPKSARPLFIVVGNGREYRKRVEDFMTSHGLADTVHIETSIHDTRVLQALYTEALCLMYPSFYEGFGLPVVEASLQCCPVLTSNLSSLPEAAGDSALQCNPSSVDEITQALQQLLGSEAERKQRGAAGRNYALQRFSPDVLTSQMYDLYQSLI